MLANDRNEENSLGKAQDKLSDPGDEMNIPGDPRSNPQRPEGDTNDSDIKMHTSCRDRRPGGYRDEQEVSTQRGIEGD